MSDMRRHHWLACGVKAPTRAAAPRAAAMAHEPELQVIAEQELVMGERIGDLGSFGEVRRAVWGGTPVAVKSLQPSASDVGEAPGRAFDREVRALAALHHPNIVQVLGVVRWADGRVGLVEELAAGGSLWAQLGGGAGGLLLSAPPLPPPPHSPLTQPAHLSPKHAHLQAPLCPGSACWRSAWALRAAWRTRTRAARPTMTSRATMCFWWQGALPSSATLVWCAGRSPPAALPLGPPRRETAACLARPRGLRPRTLGLGSTLAGRQLMCTPLAACCWRWSLAGRRGRGAPLCRS